MREITVTAREAGQRLDRYLEKLMPQAPKSFFYRMLRKKNITLNGKKAEGPERLSEGDDLKLFLSEETLSGFGAGAPAASRAESAETAPARSAAAMPPILYEDADVIVVNKPQGMLSQKAGAQDTSLVEILTAYALETGRLKKEELATFHPAVCNRLDRNTSGVVIAGMSVRGLQAASRALRERTARKLYLAAAAGTVTGSGLLESWLEKDEASNTVRIFREDGPGRKIVRTAYRAAASGTRMSLLELELITGKSHQIRAQLSAAGHPVAGDRKYGDRELNRYVRDRYRVKDQLLHAFRLTLPACPELPALSGRTFTAPLPDIMRNALEKEGLWAPGTRED